MEHKEISQRFEVNDPEVIEALRARIAERKAQMLREIEQPLFGDDQ